MRKKRITVIIGRMFCGGAFNLWNRQNKTKTAMKLSAVVMLLCLMLGGMCRKQKILIMLINIYLKRKLMVEMIFKN